jgi:ribose/xylose/arabinose/galactoside ABC-type transport system permease subunit
MSPAPAFERIFGRDDATDLTLWLLDNMILPILLVAVVVFSLALPDVFATPRNLQFLLYASAPLGVLVLAESLCLLSGNFDLSVGSITGFSAMFTALFMARWFPGAPWYVGVLLVVAIGGFIGALNGFSVAYLDVDPFLQTLSFFIIFRGATVFLSTLAISDLPAQYLYLGDGSIAGVPVAIPVVLVLFALAGFVLRYRPVGQAVYATGGDEQAATEAGIRTKRVVFAVFVISGLLSGFAGLLYTGFVGAAVPSLGEGTVFSAFAASVIGGISLEGGRGKIAGAFGGVLLLGAIETGLVQLQVDPAAVQMFNGLVLLVAILLYSAKDRIRNRVLAA